MTLLRPSMTNQPGLPRGRRLRAARLAPAALPILLAGCGHPPPVSVIPPASSAAWVPDPALLSRLGPEVQMDGFSIRPPQGCTFTQTAAEDAQNTLVRYKWRQERQDGSSMVFSVHVGRAKPGSELEPDAEAALQGLVDHNGADYQDYAHSNIETGEIGGVPFARAYWKGVSPPDSPQQHGLFYLTSSKQVNVTIHGTDSEPSDKRTLPLCEAAALTFRLR